MLIVTRRRQWICLMSGMLLLLCATAHADPLTPVTLQLRWHHQFQFAGYYAAKQQGYYREAGLDVTIVAGNPNRHSDEEVLAGRAHFGVGNSEVLYDRLQGKPLVALAAIFQHSASTFIVKQSSGIRSPQDFAQHRVMMLNTRADVELIAMLSREGLALKQVKLLDSSFNINDLINDRTDVFNAYISNEPYLLSELDIPFTVIAPAAYGVDFYSDVLFTSEQQIQQSAEVVKAFRKASLQGWDYALRHPGEIIALIRQEYDSNKSVKHLRYEAESMRKLIMPDLISIGHMNPGRWQHMADTFVSEGFVKPGFSLKGFLYNPYPEPDSSGWLKAIAGLTVVSLLISVISIMLLRFNRRLRGLIARQQQAEKELSRQKSLFEAIFNSSPDAAVLCDIERKIIMCNPAFQRIFGYTPDEVVGHKTDILYVCKKDFETQGKLHYNRSATTTLAPFEINYRRKNKQIFPSETQGCVVKDQDGEVLGFLGVMRDITLKKKAEDEIKRLAMTDSLTGLANRYLFERSLVEALSLAKRNQQQVSLALMDLDYFKQVNDSFGHSVGDMVLKYAASVLKRTFRQSDVIARIGGDEFAILMYAPDDRHYAKIPAERVIDSLSSPVMFDTNEVCVGASFGIASFPEDADEAEDLLVCADKALYESKRLGRNRCSIYQTPPATAD